MACVRAEQCIRWHFHIVKEQLGRVLRVHPDLVENTAATETFQIIRFHNEKRFREFPFATRIGHDNDKVRRAAIGDEGL